MICYYLPLVTVSVSKTGGIYGRIYISVEREINGEINP